jgi:hypothetical protein
MRKIHRATAGAAFGLVLAAGFVPAIASATTSAPDVPSIPGASAERPIVDSSTSIYTVQGATAQGDRDGNRLFVTGEATPEAQVTSTVTGGTLKIVDASGHVLCIGTAKADRPNLYSCEFEPLVSGPQTITAAVVKKNGTYSTPSQAELDAYAATPTIDSVTRDGDDLVVVGHGNLRAGVEASIDRKSVLASARTDSDGSFRISIPGGAEADQAFVRTVNDAIPADTPDHDRFAASQWALAEVGSDAGSGGETPNPGEGSGSGEETPNPGEGSGSGEETPNPGEGSGSGGETPNPGEGSGSGEETPNPGEGSGSGSGSGEETPDPGEGVTPVYDVTSPADGATVQTSQPTFTGHGRPNGRVSVMAQGGPSLGVTTADADGNWEVQIEGVLHVGQNGLDIMFERADGTWERKISQAVTWAPKADGFTITTPADGSTVTDARPTVAGSAVGSYRQVMFEDENGTVYAEGKTDADGAFSLPFTRDLTPGVNDLVVLYQGQDGAWAAAPYTLRYDSGEEPGDGEQGGSEQGGSEQGGSEQPGDGDQSEAPEFAVAQNRISESEVAIVLHGAEGATATVSANGTTKDVTLGSEHVAQVVVPAPEKLTTAVSVAAEVDGETVRRTVVVGDGEHASDALEAAVASTNAAFGSAKLTLWGLPTGPAGVEALDADGERLALGAIGADGEGSLTLTGLASGTHEVALRAGGLTTTVSVTI